MVTRDKRQRDYYLRVTIMFVFFCVFAAPLDFHIKMYSHLTSARPNWLSGSLLTGSMYFYAIVLCIEANLRLEHYHRLLFSDMRIYILRCLLVIPLIVAFFQYFVGDLYSGTVDQLPPQEQAAQLTTGVLALTLSLIIHHHITVFEMRRVR